MKISKVLFDDPRTARNVASTMHEAPRESKAWLGWLLLGVMAGGAIVGTWSMYQERYRTPAASQSGGQLSQPTAGAR